QRIHVPAGVFAEPVEGKTKSPKLRLSEARKDHGRNLLQAKLPGSKNQAPTRHHSTRLIDDNREHEAELLDARLELADMAGRNACGCLFRAPAVGPMSISLGLRSRETA